MDGRVLQSLWAIQAWPLLNLSPISHMCVCVLCDENICTLGIGVRLSNLFHLGHRAQQALQMLSFTFSKANSSFTDTSRVMELPIITRKDLCFRTAFKEYYGCTYMEAVKWHLNDPVLQSIQIQVDAENCLVSSITSPHFLECMPSVQDSKC